MNVTDDAPSGSYNTDIDDQTGFVLNDTNTWNYRYDAVGNLISDKQEEIAAINWNVQHKIKSVHRLEGSIKPDLEFKYDATGHRIAKIEKPAGSQNIPANWKYTYYELDPAGNALAVYEKRKVNGEDVIVLKEQYVYGSKRIGSIQRDLDVTGPFLPMPNATPVFQRVLGKKQYELSNHLGNVLSVVSDMRSAHLNGSVPDYYTAKVSSSADYYAFGSPMQGRDFMSDHYRYGFNGMEKDNEVKGNGNSYTSDFRQYDSRLGRWLSLDPKMEKFPNVSPFVSFNDNPVYFIDPFGDQPSNKKNWEIHEGEVRMEVARQFGEHNVASGIEVEFEYNGKVYTVKPDNLTRTGQWSEFENLDAKSGNWQWTEGQAALNEAVERGPVTAKIVVKAHADKLGLFSQEITIVGQQGIVEGDIAGQVAKIKNASVKSGYAVRNSEGIKHNSTGAKVKQGLKNSARGVAKGALRAGKAAGGALSVLSIYNDISALMFSLDPTNPNLPSRIYIGFEGIQRTQNGSWIPVEAYEEYGEDWEKHYVGPYIDPNGVALFKA
ncbi:MAG TPA: RHS repeat-associated core domain-containing protein [Bacteroidia bacterium]|nr:RHS repeat-associated core domain-containing protein [Bacteroidia bacterium]